ncbi:MAG: hypothetical protein ACRCYO_12605 [Bacteroidia bacterium]
MKALKFFLAPGLSLAFFALAFKPVPASDSNGFIRGTVEDNYVLGAKTEIFKINATMNQTILGIQGTEVDFPANCFMYENGEPHNCGSVYIKMREYCNKATLAESGLTTQSGYQMLESGGTVHLEAWCANHRLLLREGSKITIHFPKINGVEPEGMQLFAGQDNGDGLIDWKPSGSMSVDTANQSMIGDWIGEGENVVMTIEQAQADSLDRLTLQSGELEWINCDRFYDVPETEKAELFVNVNMSDPNMRMRLIFKDLNCVMPGYETEKKGEFLFPQMPKGSRASLLTFYRAGQQVAFCMRDVTIGDKPKEDVQLTWISLDQFKLMMASLTQTP